MSMDIYKIILVGQEGVGKTSLQRRLVYGKFGEDNSNAIGIRIDQKQLTVDGVECSLQLWDLAGQITKDSTPSSFYEKIDGVMLVFDLSKPSSYLNIQQFLQFIEGKAPDAPRILAANKADLLQSDEINRVLEEANLENEEVIIASAKEGLNTEYAFTKLARLIGAQKGR